MVYLAVALSAALGGFVQSITGFGAAVVMMTILPYFFTMAVAPSVSTSICLGLTVTLAWKLRKSIDLKLTLPPTLLYAAASVTAIRFIGSPVRSRCLRYESEKPVVRSLCIVVGR